VVLSLSLTSRTLIEVNTKLGVKRLPQSSNTSNIGSFPFFLAMELETDDEPT
jgi:hypothetical protein